MVFVVALGRSLTLCYLLLVSFVQELLLCLCGRRLERSCSCYQLYCECQETEMHVKTMGQKEILGKYFTDSICASKFDTPLSFFNMIRDVLYTVHADILLCLQLHTVHENILLCLQLHTVHEDVLLCLQLHTVRSPYTIHTSNPC